MIPENKLSMLIDAYAAVKAQADKLKSDVDNRNKEIKELMSKENIDSFDTGSYTAKFTVQKRETMNEDKLIGILQNAGFDGKIVKLKPYVDMDALESSIYHGEISEEVQGKIAQCVSVKEVPTLKVTKNKEDKK